MEESAANDQCKLVHEDSPALGPIKGDVLRCADTTSQSPPTVLGSSCHCGGRLNKVAVTGRIRSRGHFSTPFPNKFPPLKTSFQGPRWEERNPRQLVSEVIMGSTSSGRILESDHQPQGCWHTWVATTRAYELGEGSGKGECTDG